MYHTHIPRTGGRYIAELFRQNNFQIFHTGFEHHVRGIEIPHLHYPLYNFLECAEDSKKMVIVRNPYDKFVSQIKAHYIVKPLPVEFFDLIKDKDWLFSFLDFERDVDSYATNWYRPQNEFIEDESLIYKFEDGLNENFVNWLKTNFNIDFKYIDNAKYDLTKEENIARNFNIVIDPSVRKYIEEYYEEDYSKLNYAEGES